MEYIKENIPLIRQNYHDMIMGYPLDTEEVWDKEFIIRDKLEEKGYGIINFVNFPLIIKHDYFGHFNAINGDKSKLVKLHHELRHKCGFTCFLRTYEESPSRGAIIFPENVDCELLEYVDRIEKYEQKEVFL